MQSLQAFSTSLEEAKYCKKTKNIVFIGLPHFRFRLLGIASPRRLPGCCDSWASALLGLQVQPWRVVDQQRGGSRQNLALTGGAASSPFLLQLMVLGIAWALRVMVLSTLSAASGHSQNFNTVFSPAVRLEAIQQIVRKQGKSEMDELLRRDYVSCDRAFDLQRGLRDFVRQHIRLVDVPSCLQDWGLASLAWACGLWQVST